MPLDEIIFIFDEVKVFIVQQAKKGVWIRDALDLSRFYIWKEGYYSYFWIKGRFFNALIIQFVRG